MTEIRKKIQKQYFDLILAGKKKFELRLADFEIKEGDILILEEWDSDNQEYTGRKVKTTATYIIKTKEVSFWSQEDIDKYGFQIIQFDVNE